MINGGWVTIQLRTRVAGGAYLLPAPGPFASDRPERQDAPAIGGELGSPQAPVTWLTPRHRAAPRLPGTVSLARLNCIFQACVATVKGRILTPPPERRIHPAAPVPLARLPDESGVPVVGTGCAYSQPQSLAWREEMHP